MLGESQVDLRFYQVGAQAQDFVELSDGQFKLPTLHRLLACLEVGGEGLLGRLLGETHGGGEKDSANQTEHKRSEIGNHRVKLNEFRS